jgi:hypothetical protein
MPTGGNGNVAVSVVFCLERSVIGMGWPVPNEGPPDPRSSNGSRQPRLEITAMTPHVIRFEVLPSNLNWATLCGFGIDRGRFYLAEITEPWKYEYEDPVAIGADIVSYREAGVIVLGVADAVPGKLIARFRPSRTFQTVRSRGVLAFSSQLADLSSCSDTVLDLYEVKSDADVENLAFVYLDIRG